MFLSPPLSSHTTCDGSKTTIFLEQLLGFVAERNARDAIPFTSLYLSLFVKPLTFILSGHTSCQFLFRYYPVNICLKVFFLHIFIRSYTKVGECLPLGRFQEYKSNTDFLWYLIIQDERTCVGTFQCYVNESPCYIVKRRLQGISNIFAAQPSLSPASVSSGTKQSLTCLIK